MKNQQQKFNRRSIRVPGYDYTQPGAYFVTICTWKQICLFGEIINGSMVLSKSGQIACHEWARLSKRFPQADFSPYVIMPNHVHGIITISSQKSVTTISDIQTIGVRNKVNGLMVAPGSIGAMVRAYKSSVTWRLHATGNPNRAPIWQRNYYEHIVRNEQELQAIADYIEFNPQTWEKDRLYSPIVA